MEHNQHVPWYTTGVLRLPVHFPTDRTDCRHCIRFCKPMEDRKLFRCTLLETTIEPCDLDTRHPECPIDFSDF